jgi:hypothetical protein
MLAALAMALPVHGAVGAAGAAGGLPCLPLAQQVADDEKDNSKQCAADEDSAYIR